MWTVRSCQQGAEWQSPAELCTPLIPAGYGRKTAVTDLFYMIVPGPQVSANSPGYGAASCYTIDVSDAESSKPNYVGCSLIAIPILALFVGAGLWLGQRQDAAKTPCQRYASVAARVLHNCHSGLTKALDHHTAVCERVLDPTPACLERLDALTCEELQLPPEVAAGAACSRK